MRKKFIIFVVTFLAIYIGVTGCRNKFEIIGKRGNYDIFTQYADAESAPYVQTVFDSNGFSESFIFFNYTVKHPSSYKVTNHAGRRYELFAQDSFTVYYYSVLELGWLCPFDFEDLPDVDVLEKSIEACKTMVYYNIGGSPSSCTQTVNVSEQVNINGNDMLRVEGTIQDHLNNKSYEYVAYYFNIEKDGAEYQAYALGIPKEGSLSEAEEYLDEAMNHMKKDETLPSGK